MKVLYVVLLLLLLAVLAHTQDQQCVQTEFSGEAAQDRQFNQELGQGLLLSVIPMRGGEWSWFKIRVFDESHSVAAFNLSDENWLLATPNWGSAFIGGWHSNQQAALEYRSRYLPFPLSFDDKDELREKASLVNAAKNSEEEESAVASLRSMRLGHIKFEITDCRLGNGEPPTSVDWVKFSGTVTVPYDFRLSGKMVGAHNSLRYVDCPGIPDEVIENIRNPKLHEYFLPAKSTSPEP